MEIKYLSKEFYEKYSNCKEMLQKENRPYVIIVIQIGKFILKYKKDVIRHKNNPNIPENPRFRFCTLQYFQKELGLD